MSPRQIHAHPSNPDADPVDGCELEVGDRLEPGDVYAWGLTWWPTAFPDSAVRDDDPIFIRPSKDPELQIEVVPPDRLPIQLSAG